MTDAIAPQDIFSCNSFNVTTVSSSAHKYLNYSRKMQLQLAELNNNVSGVIRESCSGIDNICNRVRQCLNEMDQRHKTYLMDEVTEHSIEEEKPKSVEEISEVYETMEDISTIEIIEEKFETEESSQDVTSLTPFFTEINYNNQDPESRKSCQKKVLNKTIYSLLNSEESMELHGNNSRISVDNFKDTITSLCDNFEIMNKLVENINKEITKFSETAIPTAKKSLEKIEINEVSESTTGLKPIKRMSKSNSRQKCIQVGDSAPETEVDLVQLNDSTSFIIPDVYRKRAFTDLYKKLVAQVEANDSLMFFQTLMNRHKKVQKKKGDRSQFKLNIPIVTYSVPKKSGESVEKSNCSIKIQPTKKNTNLHKKYADSLWFSPKNIIRDSSRLSSRKVSRKNVRTRKANSKTVESRGVRSEQKSERRGSLKKKTATCESNRSLDQSKHSPKFSTTRDAQKACSLECTCKMVVQNHMPLSASTKCQLQWLKATPAHTPQRKLKFLDILDDLTHRDLLPLQSEYPRKDQQQARELDYKDIQDTYLYKLMYGKQSTKNVWKQLLEPTIQCVKNNKLCRSRRNVNKMKFKAEKVNENLVEKFCSQNYSKSDILKKLAPYIYDPEKTHENYSQSVIVMPVRVYYDNFKTNEPPTRLSNSGKPILNATRKVSGPPSKDVKWMKLSELSTPRISKPIRVVYDNLPKKQEIPSIITSISPSAMPSKSLINSARLNTEKNATKKATSRSFPPKSFASYCQNVRNSKKDRTDIEKQENIALYNKIQADIEKIKTDIYGKKVNPADRKLWAHKYGKGVGQKLISFVQHERPEPERHVPLYAMPKLDIVATPPMKRNTINFSEKTSAQRQVLSHVQSLKTKNEAIQSNLKKAIKVIETRMVDILCDDSKSIQAFDIMEKEIRNVLSLMRCKGKTDLKAISSKICDSKDELTPNFGKNVNASLQENYNIISEHLFERLERILDTGGSSTSNTSIHKTEEAIQKKVKDEAKKKQRISSSRRTKIDIISPSSSASLDEKVINRRSPKAYSKKMEKIEVKPKLSATTTATITESIPAEHWKNTCGDQNLETIESETCESQVDSKHSEDEKTHISEEQIYHNSSGDFIKQEDVVMKKSETSLNVEINDTPIDEVVSDDKAEKLTTEEEKSVIPAEIPTPKPELEQSVNLSDTTINSDIEEFITEELNKVIDSIVSLAEETTVEQPQNEPVAPVISHFETENFESSDYNTPRSQPSNVDNKMQVAIKDDTLNYSEEVQKILKRVENIYSQLDDIQESESKDQIPIFKEENVSDIQSEIFLTPFMQAVKETRKTVRQTSKMTLVEKSPSYYNIITFLDALTNIQKEAPYEVHIAQLYNYAHVCRQATVYYLSEIWHEAQYSSSTSISLRTSCMRKSSEETRQLKNKKVSFFQLGKEDKSNQITLCPFHKVKVLRISSQQFPPMESSDEEMSRKVNESNRVAETKNVNKVNADVCPLHSSDPNKHQDPLTDNEPEPLLCKLHRRVRKTTEELDSDTGKHTKSEGGCEKTKKHELSVIDDKSTQVFCQMHTEEKQEENSIVNSVAEEATCLTTEYLEENPDDSKSTDKDFLEDSLLDPFYDYTNESVTPKQVMQNIEGIYEEGNAKNSAQTQPKIVVFREVLEEPLPPPKDMKNVNDIEQYKKSLEKRKEMRLTRKSSTELVRRKISPTPSNNDNVVLLKSFYAIVYILMFTALSLNYRCI